MEKRIDWQDLYTDKCLENSDLKNEIRVIQEILRSYLPIVGVNEDNGSINK
jgi:hypothetical protein